MSQNLSFIFTLKQNVIFIDTPWGVKEYKDKYNIKLNLGNISIEKLINMFLNNKICNYVVLKLPTNYDLNYLRNNIEDNKKIIINKLYKMFLIIVFSFNY